MAAAATRVEAARQALAAATEHDGDDRFGWSATQAYLQAREAALAATDLGVQLHGGHGYLQGRPTERYFREARMLTLLLGGADAAVDDLADRLAAGPPIALAHTKALLNEGADSTLRDALAKRAPAASPAGRQPRR